MTKEIAMDLTRFEALADAYGGDLRRWPATERVSAQALLADEPAAKRLLAAADDLDHLLSASHAPAASPALRAAILAAAPKPRRNGGSRFGFWLSGAGLAAAAVAGLLVGATASDAVVHAVQTEAVLAEVLPDEVVDILPLSGPAQGDVV